MEATFKKGDPIMVDYTPSSAVDAGDVLVIGNQVRIAHLDIAANEKGSLAAGDGVYEFAKAITSGTGWSDGALLYWDNSGKKATTTASSNKKIGVAVGAAADSDATCRVLHVPQAV